MSRYRDVVEYAIYNINPKVYEFQGSLGDGQLQDVSETVYFFFWLYETLCMLTRPNTTLVPAAGLVWTGHVTQFGRDSGIRLVEPPV